MTIGHRVPVYPFEGAEWPSGAVGRRARESRRVTGQEAAAVWQDVGGALLSLLAQMGAGVARATELGREEARRRRSAEGLRRRAEREARRWALLGRTARRLLECCQDYELTLRTVVQAPVPELADFCLLNLKESGGGTSLLFHPDPDPDRLAHLVRLYRRFGPENGAGCGIQKVLGTGVPEFYGTVSARLLDAHLQDGELAASVRAAGIRGAIVAPLVAHGEVLGVMTLLLMRPRQRYTRADLRAAEELGRIAGLALHNARSLGRLRQSLEDQDEFLGLLSHELRGPITTIYGGARSLRLRGDVLDREMQRGLLGSIEEGAERLYRTVEDLLTIARVELGQEPPREPVPVGEVARRVAAAFQHRRPHRRIEVRTAGAGLVLASATCLEHVLRNLIANADKYSPPQAPIEVAVEERCGQVQVKVLDRGPGVPPEEAPRLFQRFYRARNATVARGLGLGLTVCKRLVEAQGGCIWARSREGGGLEVAFSLPLYEGGDGCGVRAPGAGGGR